MKNLTDVEDLQVVPPEGRTQSGIAFALRGRELEDLGAFLSLLRALESYTPSGVVTVRVDALQVALVNTAEAVSAAVRVGQAIGLAIASTRIDPETRMLWLTLVPILVASQVDE